MVRFDHRDEGTTEEAWLASTRWRTVDALVLTGIRRLVVVSAHPDDESLGAGGLIARAHALGAAVHLVVATNGDGSHPQSPSMTPQQLAALRRRELLSAMNTLAPDARIDFLDLPDGLLRAHADRLREHLGSLGIGEGTLVVAPWRSDGHGDHEVAGTIASAVAAEAGAQSLEYPVWMWHWARPDDPAVPWNRFVTLELSDPERDAKQVAVRAHASQNSPLSAAVGDEVLLSERFHDYFERPFEVFIAPPVTTTLTEHYFDEFYDGKDDPWGFETRWYEIRKRAITIASLPRPLFSSGLELGCSIGVLTADLAGRCARLVATDIAERPLAAARARLADQSHVSVLRADASVDVPAGPFDLVVLSEVAYYWSPDDLQQVLARIDSALSDDGVLVACHWRHPVDGYPERGDKVHAALRAFPGWELLSEHREEDFLLDVFARPPAESVARQTGLL